MWERFPLKRLSPEELLPYLQCLECSEALSLSPNEVLVCRSCGAENINCNTIPVLISRNNDLFPKSAYETETGGRIPVARRRTLQSLLKSLVPSRSLNLARERMFATIAKEHGQSGQMILVVGCGNQQAQLKKYFSSGDTTFVFCDVDKAADADVICDAHELPFKPESFDGVIATAVMEHVMQPDQVAEEMHRVLKEDGFIYSEIPFLQGVHEGAYDFTRYTLTGHRRLYEKFEEIDAGMVAGPGTNLNWQIVDCARMLSRNTRMSSGLALIARVLFFWVKYADYILQHNPKALDAASCTYFYGKRQTQACKPSDVIARYGVSSFSHT